MRILAKFTILLISVLAVFTLSNAKAQDPLFSQFYANPLYLNPALTGVDRCPRFIMNYRNQWPAIPGQFVTYSASYDQHVDAISGGLGGQVIADEAGNGILRNINASAFYSYDLPVNRYFSIRAGFQATYFQKSIDWDQLTFGDQIDPRYGFIYNTNEIPIENNVNGVDFSAGILGYTKSFYGGFAVHHLTEPDEKFLTTGESLLPRKFTAHAGFYIPYNKRYPDDGYFSPNIMFKQQGEAFSGNPNARQTFLGFYTKKGPLVGGLWYRFNDAMVAVLGIQTDYIRFGYSYDITISDLTNATGGAHEISVALNFDCPPKRVKYRPLNCPKF